MATNNSINFTEMKISDKEKIINILQDIQNRNITKLDPLFEPTLGFSYPVIDHYNSSLHEQIFFLESCMKLGIFNRKSSVTLLKCNSCNSLHFYNKFVCTLCKSSNIVRGITIGHDSCGNVDFDYKYMTLDGSLVCQKCNKKLKAIGVDYSKIGYFYKCLECSALLPDMDQHYLCLKCGTTSLQDELQILHLFSYTVDLQKVAEKLNGDNFMISVVRELDKVGIKSTLTEVIYGISGLQHNFSLVTYDMKDLPFVIVDELESQKNNNNNNKEAEILVLSFITKCLDVKVPNKILLAIPSLKENLKELLRMNGIILVEAQTKDEAALDLTQTITEIYNRM